MIRFLFIFAFAVFLVGVVMGGSFVWDAYMISPEDDAETFTLMVNTGDTVKDVSARLKAEDIIQSPFFFESYVWLTGTQAAFQAGMFTLQPGMNYQDLVEALTHAEAQEVQVTIPEGYTAEETGDIIREELPRITEESWVDAIGANSSLFVSETHVLAGIPDGQGVEGYLFPDTYRYTAEASAETVAETMVLTLKRRLAENEILIPDDLVMENGMTLHEVLVLASVIEKEAPTAEDMKIVADIFLKRLEIGMALQACSTVNYVTGKDDPAVTYDDQQVDSPYNTYQRVGLPPGPIANPGMNAIIAVLQPTENEYYYFLTTPAGEMIYSKTYDEHVYAKQLYLK